MPFTSKITSVGGRLEVNGEDITDRAAAWEVRVNPGQPSTLVIFSSGEGTIEGEGIVQVVDPAQGDADLICEFLGGIDPDQLDADALNDADASSNLTAVLLATLQRYARGQ